MSKIKDLENLPDDWNVMDSGDTPSGKIPPKIIDTCKVIEQLLGKGWEAYPIACYPTGVQFEKENDGGYLEIEVSEKGINIYFEKKLTFKENKIYKSYTPTAKL